MLIKIFGYLKSLFAIPRIRISLLIAASAVIGFLIRDPVLSRKAWLTFLSVLFLSSAASAFDNYNNRKIASKKSISLGAVMLIHAFVVMSILGQITVIIAGISALIIYNGIYTPQKSKTKLALIPGIISTFIAPMMGFIAAGGRWSMEIMTVMLLPGLLSFALLWEGKLTWI